MSIRRCANPTCTGVLPDDKGKHCPRCGGTEFKESTGSSGSAFRLLGYLLRRRLLIVLALLIVAGVVLIYLIRTEPQLLPAPLVEGPVTPERRQLMDLYEIASKMGMLDARDKAYADIVRRALAQNDFEYACKVGESIGMYTHKDKALGEIVDAAIDAHMDQWADRAAELMASVSNRDAALGKIMEARAKAHRATTSATTNSISN